MSNAMTEAWITKLIADGDAKWVYLKNGIRLVGTIVEQDADAILLRGSQTGSETLVYKDMVSTIVRTPDK